MRIEAIERDAVGNKVLVPLGFSKKKDEFAYLRKIANCKCTEKENKSDCEIYDYEDAHTPCVANAIEELVIQDLKTDKSRSLKKAKKPSEPILCEEAIRILKEQEVSIAPINIQSFPTSLNGERYRASVKIIPKEPYEGDRVNFGGEETHQIILMSSAKGEKKIGEFSNSSGASSAIDSKVVGFIRTPDSDRIIVVTSVLGRFFEEETTESIRFWGASLVNGFKKEPSKREKQKN